MRDTTTFTAWVLYDPLSQSFYGGPVQKYRETKDKPRTDKLWKAKTFRRSGDASNAIISGQALPTDVVYSVKITMDLG